jgi:hypothetical protein
VDESVNAKKKHEKQSPCTEKNIDSERATISVTKDEHDRCTREIIASYEKHMTNLRESISIILLVKKKLTDASHLPLYGNMYFLR